MAEVKLPLRKLNVWISVKVDMETHLRLPQASREEIKPEMDVPVARGRAAQWDGRWGNRCDREWKLKAREGTRGTCAGARGELTVPGLCRAVTGKLFLFNSKPFLQAAR